MSDLSDLQSITGPGVPAATQGESPAPKKGDGPEAFRKVLKEVGDAAETGPIKDGNGPAGQTSAAGHPSLSPSKPNREVKQTDPIEDSDKKTEAFSVSTDSLNPNPIIVMNPLLAGVVQDPLSGESSSLPLSSADDPLAAPPLSHPNQMAMKKIELAPIATPNPGEALSKPVDATHQQAEGAANLADQGDPSGGLAVGEKALHPMLEKMLQSKGDKRPGLIVPPEGETSGFALNGTASLKVASTGGTEKESPLLSNLGHADRNGSEETGGQLGSNQPGAPGAFANELSGMGMAGASSSAPASAPERDAHAASIARSGDLIQSKITAGAAPSDGIPDAKQLLHQISEKWSLTRSNNGHSFRIQLEPETLGTLQVDISVHQERVVAEIVTKHPFVKELLEGNQEMLRGTLAEQGMKVDRFSVNVGDPGQASLGWENPLRRRGADLPFYSTERPFLPIDGGEVSSGQRGIKEGAWSAINIYV